MNFCVYNFLHLIELYLTEMHYNALSCPGGIEARGQWPSCPSWLIQAPLLILQLPATYGEGKWWKAI